MAHDEDGILLVHAGVLPQWASKQTVALAGEVESVLRGPGWTDFMQEMYGDQPARWQDDLTGTDRLRCIVNGLTRLRFCSEDGEMEFDTREGLSEAPAGFVPWFDVQARRTKNDTIIFGHWSTLGLLLRPNLIALDTGCVWGRQLTAVRLEDRALYQVDCRGFCVPGVL
jgi:bis(5'-nucleosyl)-tetraphosphatase (symmetrical)